MGALFTVLALMTQPALAIAIAKPILKSEVVAKAAPDECFNGMGQRYVPGVAGCREPDQPKVNQAYVWGMTKTDTHIWFGTVANTLCLVNGTYHQLSEGMETDSWVCELSESKYPDFMAAATGKPSFLALKQMGLGDWRTPKIYRYNPATGANDDMTPAPNTAAGQLLLTTIGLRSAGTQDGVVFLAGPGFTGGGVVVNMFAFDAATGALLGAKPFPRYNNIRKWVSAKGELYTAVGFNEIFGTSTNGNTHINYGGRVLKWTGDKSHPFEFAEVGLLPGSGAELALHENRLFVTTWPSSELASQTPVLSGLYMSPALPVHGGLDNSTAWKEIWNASHYDPDPAVASTYGGGAVASFDGHLYWGTMHVPGLSLFAVVQAYGLDTSDESLMQDALISSHRAISIFRASNFSDNGAGRKELLYGDSTLKRYIPPRASFVSVPNNMGGNDGIWGKSGFGNTFNNYTWAMNVFQDKLYIGTMDWSYLGLKLYSEIGDLFSQLGGSNAQISFSPEMAEILSSVSPGADLWRIEESNGDGAIAENLTGVGNYGSYGIRTMVSDADTFYLGMANPMNLMTDDYRPKGGWELIKMTEDPFANIGIGGVPVVGNDNNNDNNEPEGTIVTTVKTAGTTGSSSSTSGGGCTYNPNNTKFDIMFFLLMALSLAYPWRHRLIK